MATNLKFHGVGQFGMGILFYGKYCTGSPRSRKRNELMAGGTQLMIAAVSSPSPLRVPARPSHQLGQAYQDHRPDAAVNE
jgi:hypothetical protein